MIKTVPLLTMLFLALSSESRAADIPVRNVLLTIIDDIRVPAREAGVLSNVRVAHGTVVKAGDELARIDDKRAKLELDAAQADVKIAAERASNDSRVRYAAKTRGVAEAELRRAGESNRKFPGSISESHVDALRLAVAKAEAEVDLQKQELKIAGMEQTQKEVKARLARNNVERRVIHSPIDGMVIEVQRKAGEWVKPGDSVFRVVRLDTLRVKGFIKASVADRKLAGRTVRVHVTLRSGATAMVQGRVVFVSPLVDPDNNEIAVWADVPNKDGRLQPGLRGSMTILGTR